MCVKFLFLVQPGQGLRIQSIKWHISLVKNLLKQAIWSLPAEGLESCRQLMRVPDLIILLALTSDFPSSRNRTLLWRGTLARLNINTFLYVNYLSLKKTEPSTC